MELRFSCINPLIYKAFLVFLNRMSAFRNIPQCWFWNRRNCLSCWPLGKPRSHRTPCLNHVQEIMKIWWTWSEVVIFGQFWLGRAFYGVWPSAAVPLLKHCSVEALKNPFVSDKLQNTRYFPWYQRVTPVRWPCSVRDRPINFRVSPSFNHCRNTDYHVCCTSLPRVSPVVVRGLKFWAVQNFLPRPTPSINRL